MTVTKYLSFSLFIPYLTITSTLAEKTAMNMCLPELPISKTNVMNAQRVVEGRVGGTSEASCSPTNERATMLSNICDDVTTMQANGMFARTVLSIGLISFSVIRRMTMIPSMIVIGMATSANSTTL